MTTPVVALVGRPNVGNPPYSIVLPEPEMPLLPTFLA